MFWERKKTKLNVCLENSIISLSLHVSFCFFFVLDETIPVIGGWGGLSVTQRTKTLNDVYLFLFVKIICVFQNELLKPSYLGT